MKKRIIAVLLMLLLLPLPQAQARTKIPSVLKFSQKTESKTLRKGVTVKKTYPKTANAAVTKDMRALIDGMAKEGQTALPKANAYLDVGASVYRTGDRWMSFLTVARVVHSKKQTYVDCAARVYNMKTGQRVELTDLFAPDSEGWAVLAAAVEEQLTAYFHGVQPNAEALSALCSREALEQAPFTLTPGKLSLHYRAGALYPGKKTLMHVNLYYPQIRLYLTDDALKMTDNRRYGLIALTYDDGPSQGRTMNVMNQLRLHGADATFFLIGSSFRNNDDVICREHDAGYTVASHNYYHVYTDLTAANIKKWKSAFQRKLNDLIGIQPPFMRAPGGHAREFAAGNCGLPLIQWSAATHDAPFGGASESEITRRALAGAKDGAVILMHDANALSPRYTESVLITLEKRGYLCVTVDELFSIYGVQLQPNRIYYSAEKQAKKK
ncbi:MAG: polysaccharide deacetylase family protein [Clostridia bacterium]|nr:polysaccharide deacetylase family protein [Clostridia bacterium]